MWLAIEGLRSTSFGGRENRQISPNVILSLDEILPQQRENNRTGSKSKQVGYLDITGLVEHVDVVLQKLKNCKNWIR